MDVANKNSLIGEIMSTRWVQFEVVKLPFPLLHLCNIVQQILYPLGIHVIKCNFPYSYLNDYLSGPLQQLPASPS